jgi:hypothetical protein
MYRNNLSYIADIILETLSPRYLHIIRAMSSSSIGSLKIGVTFEHLSTFEFANDRHSDGYSTFQPLTMFIVTFFET